MLHRDSEQCSGATQKKDILGKQSLGLTSLNHTSPNFICLSSKVLYNISLGKKRFQCEKKKNKTFLTTDLSNWHDFLMSFRSLSNALFCWLIKLPHSLFCYPLPCLAWTATSTLPILGPGKSL